MDRPDIADLARHLGLGPHADAIAAMAREAIRLVPFEGSVDDFGTHLGGRPAVPVDFAWPTWKGRSLAFIGQFRLADLGRVGREFGLPDAGTLNFFYEADQQPWGFDPGDAGGARVFWFPSGELAVRDLPPDLADWARYTGRPVRMTDEWTVPGTGAPEVEALRDAGGPPIEMESLWAVGDALAATAPRDSDTMHRLLGHPEEIQNEMRLECAYASNGVYVGSPEGYEHPRAAEFQRGALDWHLLLQVDSDPLLGTEFGDVGRIYYWITREAVAERAFDRVWQILQCT